MKLVDKILWESVTISSNSRSKNDNNNTTERIYFPKTHIITLKSTNMKSVDKVLQNQLLIKEI